MEAATPTVPAPSSPPAPVSTTETPRLSAPSGATRRERNLERAGLAPTPAAAPVAESVTASPASVAPAPVQALSGKERRQQIENDRIRAAVEQGITERLATERSKWEQEHGRPAPTTTPVQPVTRVTAAPPAPPKTFEEAIQRPDLSHALLTEEAFFQQFPEAPYSAYARYASHYDFQSRSQVQQQQTAREAISTAQRAQIEGFVQQLRTANAADPAFKTGLSEEVKTQLKPFSALQRDASGRQIEPPGPINVVGEQVYRSAIAPQMLKHFSSHPEDLRRLTTVPTHLASLPTTLQIAEHIQWIAREYGKIEASVATAAAPAPKPSPVPVKTVSDAPAPARGLGSRPASAPDERAQAIRTGDTRTYRRLSRERYAREHGISVRTA